MNSCPVDGETLSELAVPGAEVEACDQCGGKWFGNGQLTVVTKQGLRVLAQLDVDSPNRSGQMPPPGGKQCPSCAAALVAFSFKQAPKVVLEGCPSCKGIWLDHGKATQLALRLGLPEDQLPPPTEAVEGEAARSEVECPECHAANKPSDTKCWQCGASLVPEAPCCPRCQEALIAAERDGVWLETCSACGGVWLGEESLVEVFAHHMDTCAALDSSSQRREEDMAGHATPARCPYCKVNLLEHDFIAQLEGMYNVPTGIHADRCTTCNGMWYDAGELTAVQEAVLQYRARKAEEDDSEDIGFLGFAADE